MKRLRFRAPLAGLLLAGGLALALASPASATPLSPHPKVAAVPHDAITDTVTSLTLSGGSVAFDQQPGLTANFSVNFKNRQVITPVPGGDVVLRTDLNGTTIDLCSTSLSSGGTGSCHLTSDELPPGSYQLIAHYEGILRVANHSDSGAVSLTVNREPTTLTLGVGNNNSFVYGQEAAGTDFSLSVSPRSGGTPGGTAGVSAGGSTGLCSGTLNNGSTSCNLTDTQLTPGTYHVFGFYLGDATFANSSTDSQTLTINPGIAATTLTLSQARISVSKQQQELLTAHLIPTRSGIPTGPVTFKDGSTTICAQVIVNGTATCAVPAGQLSVGKHQIIAFYNGDTNFAGSTSGAKTLTIAQPTTTALTLSTSKVRVGHEQAERLTVKVKPQVSGTAVGKVTIKAGSTTVCVITLSHGTGNCRLRPSKLRPGTYHLTATYPGTGIFLGSTSAKKRLTVTR